MKLSIEQNFFDYLYESSFVKREPVPWVLKFAAVGFLVFSVMYGWDGISGIKITNIGVGIVMIVLGAVIQYLPVEVGKIPLNPFSPIYKKRTTWEVSIDQKGIELVGPANTVLYLWQDCQKWFETKRGFIIISKNPIFFPRRNFDETVLNEFRKELSAHIGGPLN